MPQAGDDDAIIALIRDQNTNGLSLLYDKYAGALLGAIIRITQSQEIAEEVLQDTFSKAWRSFEQYDASKGRLFTWLINIARNTAIDATRKKSFGQHHQNLEDNVHNIDLQQHTSMQLDGLDLKRLTKRLAPEHQELIELIYFQGYTHTETAEYLNLPLGTVKTRVRAAITKLKELFLTLILISTWI